MSGRLRQFPAIAPGTALAALVKGRYACMDHDEHLLYFNYLCNDAAAVLTVTLYFSPAQETPPDVGDDTQWYQQTRLEHAAGVATVHKKTHTFTPGATGNHRFELSVPVAENYVRVDVDESNAGVDGEVGVIGASNYVGR